MKAPVPLEDSEQAALFQWAAVSEAAHPELASMYAIPNGGYRHPATAARMKATGVKPGVPDTCLPVPRNGFGALYIEMKRRSGGHVSVEQKKWIERLSAQGNKAVVCHGWEEAVDVIKHYLGIVKE